MKSETSLTFAFISNGSTQVGIKVTGDSLHQEFFMNTEPSVSPQRKQQWSWNKYQCGDKNSWHNFEVTLKRLRGHESQAVTAIVTISCVKFCLDKDF